MKKLLIVVLLLFSLSGCGSIEEESTEDIINSYITVEAVDDNIIISKENITSSATFVNYEVDEVIIQFVVVRGSDGVVRIAFNTCEVCSPSPNAYFIQVGEYLQCQNCGSIFSIDDIGEESGGCNPAPVEEMEETESEFIIDREYVESFKDRFSNWNGITS